MIGNFGENLVLRIFVSQGMWGKTCMKNICNLCLREYGGKHGSRTFVSGNQGEKQVLSLCYREFERKLSILY